MTNRFVAIAIGITMAMALSACQATSKPGDPGPGLGLRAGGQAAALAGRPDLNQPVQDKLNQVVPEINYSAGQIGFENALKKLADPLKLNIEVNWAVLEPIGITRAREIILHLTGATAETVLREMLTKAAGKEGVLDFIIRDGVVKVSTIEDLTAFKSILIYDARDLLARLELEARQVTADMLAQAAVIRHKLPKPQPPAAEGDEALVAAAADQLDIPIHEFHKEAATALVNLIRVMVAPDSWAPTGEATISEFSGMLVVRQTAFGQRDLARFLDQLRAKLAAADAGK